MRLKIGINGFGRIGRAIFRNNLEKNYFDIVFINDINPDINNIAYLLKYDATYGKLISKIKIAGNKMIVDGNHIKISNEKNKLVYRSCFYPLKLKANVGFYILAPNNFSEVYRSGF